jgi:hypothetical protein
MVDRYSSKPGNLNVYCLTGNDQPGHMVEGQTFTIGECINLSLEIKAAFCQFRLEL